MPTTNELYLCVLPLVHLGTGATEQVMTLLADRKLATAFTPDTVDMFALMFETRANAYLKGGNVTGYEFRRLTEPNGRIIVQVLQHVTE